jgi:glutathione peroxidase
MNTLYDQTFKDSQGNKVSMGSYSGKALLLINTATKCGLAGQFAELQVLHQKYKEKGLVVIGFPCDQFMGQEPETNESMVNVCQVNFGVTFLLSEKIDVNGKHTHPVFKYLKSHAPKSLLGNKIKWNFTKFLVSKDGTVIKRYAPTVSPLSLVNDIEDLLN